jgi:uncharacterized membrane protein
MMPNNLVLQKLRNLVQVSKQFFWNSPNRLVTYFVNGLIMIIPLAVTLWILIWVFQMIDGILAPILDWAFRRPMPGLGFAIIIISITLFGYFGIKIGHRKVFGFFERNFIKIPVVGAIYGSTRQILDSCTTSSNSKFLEVIFMEFPRKGIYTVGLVTREMKDKMGNKLFNVFIPTAPNPTSGLLQIVPESDIVKTSMSINDAMKLIVTGGKVSREDIADMLLQVPDLEGKGAIHKT